jgi:calcium-dependent protein kinase
MQNCSGGSLSSVIDQKARLNSPFSEAEASKIILKLLKALKYCHSKGVIHGDLNNSNIMFDEKNEPILIDFGTVILPIAEENSNPIFNFYKAPELNNADSKSDIWSLGIILYVMLALKVTSVGNNKTLISKMSENVSPEAFNFLSKMLRMDPKKRYSASELINHPWINRESHAESVKENFLDSDDDENWNIENIENIENKDRRVNDSKYQRVGSERLSNNVKRLGSLSRSEKTSVIETEDTNSQIKMLLGLDNNDREESMHKITEEIDVHESITSFYKIFDEESLKNMFTKYDVNSTGLITSEEALEIIKTLDIKVTKSEIENSKEEDSDQVHKISFAEFKQVIIDYHSRPLDDDISSCKLTIL